jgi:hypothetical protein
LISLPVAIVGSKFQLAYESSYPISTFVIVNSIL